LNRRLVERRRRSQNLDIMAWRSLLVVPLVALSIAGATTVPAATDYQGRPLVDVLQELQARGMNLVYSSAVVENGLRVTVEPRAIEPRALLDEILAPLGLGTRDGPAGSVLIVRAPLPAASGAIRGRVLSAGRGVPIARAVVRVAGSDLEVATRPDGTFDLTRVPVGTHDIEIAASGFSPATVHRVRVPAAAGGELRIELGALPDYVEEIVVTPSRRSVIREDQDPRLIVGAEDAVLIPTLGGDISRVVQLLPGIAAQDNSAAFNVRGSETRDVALVLDGLELYEPFHLESFQSPFSFVDTELIDRVDFLGGGFTADLGDRHGGFVKMSTWLPGDPYQGRIEVGMLNSRFSYGAPFRGTAGSWLVSVRGWYPQALRETIELGETGLNPHFGDAYAKFSFNLSPKTVLSVHGLLAYDRMQFENDEDAEEVDALNRSGYAWLRLLRSWSERVFSETVVSGGRLDRNREGVAEPDDEAFTVDDDRIVDFFGLRHDTSWEISGGQLLRAGVDIRRLESEYDYRTGGMANPAPLALRLDPSGTSTGLYVAYRVAVTPELATEIGARVDRQTYIDDEQFSPRFNAVWRPAPGTQLRFGIGRFYQSQRIHELQVEDGEKDFFPAELSEQVELTFQHRFGDGPRLRLDTYYRELSDVQPRYENVFNLVELFPEVEPDRIRIAPDTARSRGAEILLRAPPGRRLNWWASYAWSKVEDVTAGVSTERSWDQTHAVKFLTGYRVEDRWWVSLAGSWHTGWPTTPAAGRAVLQPDGSIELEEVLGPRNSDRFDDYLRFDAKASRSFPLRHGRLRLNLEVLNLTDEDNACCVDEFQLSLGAGGSVDVERLDDYWTGITPSVSVVWEF
jgi:outer membrane receptor protein involved in Fe transport